MEEVIKMNKMKNKRKTSRLLTTVLLAVIMIICVLATVPMVKSATSIVIDFEEFRAASLGGLGGRNEINDYYSSYGVRFTGATSLSKADGSLNYMNFPPRSGDAVVYDWPSGYSGTMTITFDTPQSSVGGYFTTNTALTFNAYDASGDIVGTDNSLNQANAIASGSNIPPNYYLHVDYTGGITKVVVMDGGNTYTLDDLTFTPLSDVIPPGKVSDLNAQAISLTPTGFVYPTGKAPTRDPYLHYEYGEYDGISYYQYAGWLARGDYGHYVANKYHIGQDIEGDKNDPVYSITKGEVVYIQKKGSSWGYAQRGQDSNTEQDALVGAGSPNYGYFFKHKIIVDNQEKEILALYGHVKPIIDELEITGTDKNLQNNPIDIDPGMQFAQLDEIWYLYKPTESNPLWHWDDSSEHLHFGIRDRVDEIPPSSYSWGGIPEREKYGWGAIGLNYWDRGPDGIPGTGDDGTPFTNDFADPIKWITNEIPQSPIEPPCVVVLGWTAPADDGHDKQSGPASYYDIRYSTREITEENWESATKCTGESVPGTPGDGETFIVTNLYTAYSYHFAMKSYDEMGNPSELSNDVWEITHGVGWAMCSPADIIVEDPDGLIISSDVNEIPGATYTEIDYNGDGIPDKVVMIPDKKIGDYIITVVPEPDADPTDTYSLFVFSDGITVVLAENTLISDIPDQPYIIRSTETEITQIVPVTIDINPDTLNLKSNGMWITCYIELPDGYDVVDINISTILLSDNVSAEDHPTNISDYDNDGIPDLMVKFDREAVQGILEPGESVAITVTGKLFDWTWFEGIDYIRVI